jgi:hypothetical protein
MINTSRQWIETAVKRPPRMQRFRSRFAFISSILERVCAMCHGRTSAQCGGDSDDLGYLLIRTARLSRLLRMDFDAIWALRCESDSECHEFLVLARDGSVRHGRLIEGPKCF